MTIGGEGASGFHANKGRVHTEQAKLNMRNGNKLRGIKRDVDLVAKVAMKNTGKKRSEETKRLMREKALKRKVVMLDSVTLLELNQFDSIKEANEYLAVGKSHICRAIKNNHNCLGFKWRYL